MAAEPSTGISQRGHLTREGEHVHEEQTDPGTPGTEDHTAGPGRPSRRKRASKGSVEKSALTNAEFSEKQTRRDPKARGTRPSAAAEAAEAAEQGQSLRKIHSKKRRKVDAGGRGGGERAPGKLLGQSQELREPSSGLVGGVAPVDGKRGTLGNPATNPDGEEERDRGREVEAEDGGPGKGDRNEEGEEAEEDGEPVVEREDEEDEVRDQELHEETEGAGGKRALDGGSVMGGVHNASAFAAAFSSIMRRKLPATAQGPILAARKMVEVDAPQGTRPAGAQAGNSGEEGDAGEEKAAAGPGAPGSTAPSPAARQLRLEHRERNHVRPQAFTEPKERALRRIATKGVVRLFNAVSKAQRVQQSEAAPGSFLNSAASRDLTKKTKAAFLSELRGSVSAAGRSALTAQEPSVARSGAEATASWAVLADDYLNAPQKYKTTDVQT